MALSFLTLPLTFFTLLIGSIFDLKTREIPDWLNYGLIFLGVGINLLASIIYWDKSPIIASILGLIACFIFACIMFYGGQWGGGDAKMIMGIGALIGLELSFNSFLFGLIINIFIAGAIYGLLWALYLAIIHKSKFIKEFKNQLRLNSKIRNYLLLISFLLFIFALLSFYIWNDIYMFILFLSIIFISVLSFYLMLFAKSVENACMKKYIQTDKLTPGDWIVEDIKYKGEYICGPKDLGISQINIQKLKKYKIKKVLIKEGIPFVPSFLLGFILTFLVGNWFLVYF